MVSNSVFCILCALGSVVCLRAHPVIQTRPAPLRKSFLSWTGRRKLWTTSFSPAQHGYGNWQRTRTTKDILSLCVCLCFEDLRSGFHLLDFCELVQTCCFKTLTGHRYPFCDYLNYGSFILNVIKLPSMWTVSNCESCIRSQSCLSLTEAHIRICDLSWHSHHKQLEGSNCDCCESTIWNQTGSSRSIWGQYLSWYKRNIGEKTCMNSDASLSLFMLVGVDQACGLC